jgi:hypothetical protein
MNQPGILIERLFKGKEVYILVNCFIRESLDFSQFQVENPNFISGLVIKYHDDCGVLELRNSRGQSFYLSDGNIDLFYDPSVNIVESINTIIRTGKQLHRPIK